MTLPLFYVERYQHGTSHTEAYFAGALSHEWTSYRAEARPMDEAHAERIAGDWNSWAARRGAPYRYRIAPVKERDQ